MIFLFKALSNCFNNEKAIASSGLTERVREALLVALGEPNNNGETPADSQNTFSASLTASRSEAVEDWNENSSTAKGERSNPMPSGRLEAICP